MAVGSSRTASVWLVLRGLIAIAAAGAVIGTGLVAVFSRLITPLLFKVSVFDPSAYAAATLILLLAIAAGAWWPCRIITMMNLREILSAESP